MPGSQTATPLPNRALQDAEDRRTLEQQIHHDTAQQREAERRLLRAVLLSPTLDVCEALLRGERVPLSRLDPVWVRKYGLR